MPRSGPNYSLPEPPFTPNTVISSSAVNDDFSDIASALTASLARNGAGGMTAILPLDATGFTYVNDLNTGISRPSSDTQVIECGGVDVVTVTTTEVDVAGDLDVSGSVKQNGIALLPIGLGPLPWPTATAPSGWLLCYGQSLLRTDYAALFAVIGTTFGSVDGTHFTLPDLRGRVPAGADDMGGTAANILTSTYFGTAAVLAAIGGSQSQTLTQAQLPVALGAATSVVTDPGHTHGLSVRGDGAGTNPASVPYGNGPFISFGTGQIQTATTGITVATSITNSSGGNAHAIVQPTIIFNYIIFAGI